MLVPNIIYVCVPIAGVLVYLVICQRLYAAGASWLFLGQLFFLFFCYGGTLLVLLTILFWEWSGAATLGAAFLVFVAPIGLLPVMGDLWRRRESSRAHLIAFRACVGYYLLLAAAIGGLAVASRLSLNSR